MFAIIQTGGKQFRVQNGDVIFVEKLNAAEGDVVDFEVLLYEKDGEVKIGAPTLEDVKVQGRRKGHRQPFTKVEITAIG